MAGGSLRCRRPQALAYGPTNDETMAKVQALNLRVLAERPEHGEQVLRTLQELE